MNNALIIGVILIVAGIALAILAYMVITSSGKNAGDDELKEQDPSLESAPISRDDPQVADILEVAEEDVDQDKAQDSPSIEPDPMEIQSQKEVHELEEEPASAVQETPQLSADRPRIQVATLLRDEVSGELIVLVGNREYASADALRSSPDWTRVEYAASDLSTWISEPEREAPVSKEGEGEGKTAEKEPSSMIDQINSILQERIEESGRSELAVRLIEGPGGMARVLIGVHSYEIGEVPDPEVRELIRQAVASWESTQ